MTTVAFISSIATSWPMQFRGPNSKGSGTFHRIQKITKWDKPSVVQELIGRRPVRLNMVRHVSHMGPSIETKSNSPATRRMRLQMAGILEASVPA
jgi:hypothetical protein